MAGADLGQFSVSLSVKDLEASKAFYERLGFEPLGGGDGWQIMRHGEAMIGLFEGMFEGNILTFNPGDVRAVQRTLAEQGIEAELLHEMPDSQDPTRALGIARVDLLRTQPTYTCSSSCDIHNTCTHFRCFTSRVTRLPGNNIVTAGDRPPRRSYKGTRYVIS